MTKRILAAVVAGLLLAAGAATAQAAPPSVDGKRIIVWEE